MNFDVDLMPATYGTYLDAHNASAGTVQRTCMEHQHTNKEKLFEIKGDFVNFREHFGNYFSRPQQSRHPTNEQPMSSW